MKKNVLFAAMMLMGIVQCVNAQNETNECGTLVIPANYDIIEAGNNGLFVVGTRDKNGISLGNRNGVIDSNGNIVVPMEYQSVTIGNEREDCGELILVRNEVLGNDDFYYSIEGLYNKDGIQLIPLGKYDGVSIKDRHGYNGLALVGNGSDCFILYKDGKMSPSYDNISQEESGLFSVRKNKLYGVLNKKGEIVVPIEYDGISAKGESGLIEVRTPNKNGGEKYGILNDKGEVVVPIGKYESVNVENSYIVVKRDSKKGIVNSKGVEIVPIGAYERCSIRECFERKQYYIEISSNGKKGVVNENGKVIIPIGKYNEFKVLNNDLIAVMQNGKQGLIDKNGTLILPFGKYEQLEYRYGVLTYSQNGKWGVLGKKGNQVTPAEYDQIAPARHSVGMALISKDGKVGVVNSDGKVTIPLGNYSGGDITGDVVMLKSTDGIVITKTNGEILAPIGKYDCAEKKYGKLAPLKVNALEGLFTINSNNKLGVVQLW